MCAFWLLVLSLLLGGCVGKPLDGRALTNGSSRTWQLKEMRINNQIQAIEDPCAARTQLVYHADGRMQTTLWVHNAQQGDSCTPVEITGRYRIVPETDELVDSMEVVPGQPSVVRKKLFEVTDKRMIYTVKDGMLTIEYTFVPID